MKIDCKFSFPWIKVDDAPPNISKRGFDLEMKSRTRLTAMDGMWWWRGMTGGDVRLRRLTPRWKTGQRVGSTRRASVPRHVEPTVERKSQSPENDTDLARGIWISFYGRNHAAYYYSSSSPVFPSPSSRESAVHRSNYSLDDSHGIITGEFDLQVQSCRQG